jgi:long-chain fatty acid transport protein
MTILTEAIKEMRQAKFPRIASAAIFTVAVSGTIEKAQAAGFELREGSADWMANAFAGDTAKAYDASTAW